MRSAIGLIAGPDRPPNPAPIRGRLLRASMARDTNVFTREIASALFVSENTVKTHAGRVLEKLGVNRRIKAVETGRALGIIP